MKGGKKYAEGKRKPLLFAVGDDEIQVESYCKELNKKILDLHKEIPDAVYIIDDEQPGFLRAAVKLEYFTFKLIKPHTEEAKEAFSQNGKRNSKNLKNHKRT